MTHHVINLDVHSNCPLSSGTVRTWSGLSRSRRYKLHEGVPKCPWFIFLLYCPLSPSMNPLPHGCTLWWAEGGREDQGLIYGWFLMLCKLHLEVHKVKDYSPFSGLSLMNSVLGNLYSEQNSRQHTWSYTLVRRKIMARCVTTYQLVSCNQCSNWMSGTWKEHKCKIGEHSKWGGGMWIGLSTWVKDVKIFAPYYCFPKRRPQHERTLIITWIRWPVLWIAVNWFPQSPLSLLMNKVVKVARVVVMHRFSNIWLVFTKADLAAEYLVCWHQKPTMSPMYDAISWSVHSAHNLVGSWLYWTTSVTERAMQFLYGFGFLAHKSGFSRGFYMPWINIKIMVLFLS